MRTWLLAAGVALFAYGAVVPATMGIAPAAASEIRYVVNNTPITNYDIQRRAAFLRLQRQDASTQAAADAMIDQTLRLKEMERLNIDVPPQAVDEAYQRFAQSNDLSVAQLDNIMAQSGVTKAHFLDFIRSQIGWSQALQARARHEENSVTEQEAVQRMLAEGGEKPTATEYMLQQVIFVVPEDERGARLATRRREAEAMRARFQGCDSTREFAKGLIDVTVRDLGRVLEPQLPPDWAEPIKSTSAGSATPVRETERGVEFIGICSAREVSDDTVAQMVFEAEEMGGDNAGELNDKYMAELRERGQIIQR